MTVTSALSHFDRCSARRATVVVIGVALAFSGSGPSLATVPTAVNVRITPAVTQTQVQTTGAAQATAMGTLYQVTAQALSNGEQNATVNDQQTTLMAQASTGLSAAALHSLDTTTNSIAAKTIVGRSSLTVEGILGGVSLTMFALDGGQSPFADFYVVSDRGFDYAIDEDHNLVMFSHQVRTFGDASYPATEVGFLLPPNSVATYFPELLGLRTLNGTNSSLRDVYVGVKFTDGTTSFYEGSLGRTYSVPEPSTGALTLMAFMALGSIALPPRRRSIPAATAHAARATTAPHASGSGTAATAAAESPAGTYPPAS